MTTEVDTMVTTQMYRVYIKATPGDLGCDHQARVERAVRLRRAE
jgi:hypothetical protein